jgi:tRNA nucleotidyltransferase/poly(A) polymerase
VSGDESIAASLPPDGVLARPEVAAAFALLDRDGEEALLVGGAVRNSLLGLPAGDIDFATTALPKAVMKRAGKAGIRAIPTGIEHGTVTLLVAGTTVEVTTLREDVATDGRRAVVTFGRSFAHDALRRDFTMNALYADRTGRIIDEVGGLADLAKRRVRFIGEPEKRIREDYLRILRLFRFHAAYGEGRLDAAALSAAIRLRDGLARLSAERIQAELFKLLTARRAGEVVPEVAETGLLGRILPVAPDPAAFTRVRALMPNDPLALLAALALRTRDDAPLLAARLRLSNAQADRLEEIARVLERVHGVFPALDAGALRRLAFTHGAEAVRVALAVTGARRREESPLPAAALLDQPAPSLPFSGKQVVAHGVPPGPRVGAVLARAEALWLANGLPEDAAAHRDILARALAEERAGPGA